MADVGKRSWTPGSRYLKIEYNIQGATSDFDTRYKDIIGESLFLSESPQITAGSQFGEAISHGDGIGKLKLLYELVEGTNFDKLDYIGFQVWQGSSPLKIRVNSKFFLGMRGLYSGREEVYNPIAFLTSLVLPLQGANGMLMSPSPNQWVALTQLVSVNSAMFAQLFNSAGSLLGNFTGIDKLKSAGQSLQSLTQKVGDYLTSAAAKRQQYRGVYRVIMGRRTKKGSTFTDKGSMTFPNMIITECTPTFSTEVDDEGFPIYGSVQMEFSSLFAATAKSIPLVTSGSQRYAIAASSKETENQKINFIDNTVTTDESVQGKAKEEYDRTLARNKAEKEALLKNKAGGN